MFGLYVIFPLVHSFHFLRLISGSINVVLVVAVAEDQDITVEAVIFA